jgi:hypothetical protein
MIIIIKIIIIIIIIASSKSWPGGPARKASFTVTGVPAR